MGEELFTIQARSIKPSDRLNLPGYRFWVTVCRGSLHTKVEGEAAMRCLSRDFGIQEKDMRLVSATALQKHRWGEWLKRLQTNSPSP